MSLIQDVIPASQLGYDTKPSASPAERLTTDDLVHELWQRGVTIKEIFGRYYEWEAMADGAGRLTVEDAELAGMTPPERVQPF